MFSPKKKSILGFTEGRTQTRKNKTKTSILELKMQSGQILHIFQTKYKTGDCLGIILVFLKVA